MKRAVLIDELREQEIRPLDLFDEYLDLMRAEARSAFAERSRLDEVPCPGCGTEECSKAFCKEGFAYQVCADCESLFASPRPDAAGLAGFRAESPALRFWSDHFLRDTATARRERVHRQRAGWLAALVDEYFPNAAVLVDLGAGPGSFLAEVRAQRRFERSVAVEWRPALADVCREEGLEVVDAQPEELSERDLHPDVITAFELIQQVHSPRELLAGAWRLLSPGGLLLATTLTISGFDLRVLWEQSRNVYFPQQINLLTIEGVERLAADAGFEVIELSTPGQLDVGIVMNAIAEGAPVDRFVSYLLAHRSEYAQRAFQEFLQRHLLSSHLRVALRKPVDSRPVG